MELGDKKTYVGVLRCQVTSRGAKSEHEEVLLDTGDGFPVPLLLKHCGCPLARQELEPYIGKSVCVEGIREAGKLALFVDSVEDITSTLNAPLFLPPRPPGPRP